MTVPHIAILYNFNDKKHAAGGSLFGIKREISYLEQFLISVDSIKLNWVNQNFTYSFYVIHSIQFDEAVKDRIEATGAKLIYVNHDKPTYLRTFCFTENINCDYRLVLDNDILAMSSPNFDFTKDVLGGFGGSRFNQSNTEELCNSLSIKIPNTAPIIKRNDYPFNGLEYKKYYEGTDYKDIFPYFNCGALLIKNSLSINFGNLLQKSISLAETYAKNKNFTIFLQDFYGICVNHITDNWAAFDRGFNYIINSDVPEVRDVLNSYTGNISLIHYINCNKNSTYGKLIMKYKENLK
jgi:hypothetical protein